MTRFLGPYPLLEGALGRLVVVPSATSTNRVVLEHLPGAYQSVAVLTDHQTEGRGRVGRSWVTRAGEGIAISIALPWTLQDQTSRGSWVPLVAGACVVRALSDAGVTNVGLKWPNDVLVSEQKLAGILCEVVSDSHVIVGMGLNINFDEGSPPSPAATALSHHTVVSPERLDSLLAHIVGALAEWVAESPHDAVASASTLVRSVLLSIGRPVQVLEPEGSVWQGVATGLDNSGHLLVLEQGREEPRVVVASEITHLYQ